MFLLLLDNLAGNMVNPPAVSNMFAVQQGQVAPAPGGGAPTYGGTPTGYGPAKMSPQPKNTPTTNTSGLQTQMAGMSLLPKAVCWGDDLLPPIHGKNCMYANFSTKEGEVLAMSFQMNAHLDDNEEPPIHAKVSEDGMTLSLYFHLAKEATKAEDYCEALHFSTDPGDSRFIAIYRAIAHKNQKSNKLANGRMAAVVDIELPVKVKRDLYLFKYHPIPSTGNFVFLTHIELLADEGVSSPRAIGNNHGGGMFSPAPFEFPPGSEDKDDASTIASMDVSVAAKTRTSTRSRATARARNKSTPSDARALVPQERGAESVRTKTRKVRGGASVRSYASGSRRNHKRQGVSTKAPPPSSSAASLPTHIFTHREDEGKEEETEAFATPDQTSGYDWAAQDDPDL